MNKIEKIAEIDALCPEIKFDFNIPDHKKELDIATTMIGDIHSNVKKIINVNYNDYLTEINYKVIYDKLVDMLDYVGNLSQCVFDVEFVIENAYIEKYGKSQETKLAWYNHYTKLHAKYTLLKNRCFGLLDDLDDEYIRKFSKFPPNYIEKFEEVA